jgi:hypothetical protein
MNFELAEQKCEITDDFEGFEGWVCVSYGDIDYEENTFGYYVAVWYPNLSHDLKMLVSTINEHSECVLTIGAVCKVGSINNLKPIDPQELPWGEDGVMHSGFVKPEEYCDYSKAKLAFKAAEFVIGNDKNIFNYLTKNA